MEYNIGNKAVNGAIWASIDRFVSMGIQFVVNLVLARLLLPADFGMIGMLAIFIAVSQTLIDGGFGSALIQKKKPTQTDYSTVFYWNLGFSAVLYGVLFVTSPLIAKFYSMPMLSNVLRVMALSLIITGIYAIQKTRLQKMLAFKKIAIINLSAYSVAAIVAIFFAYKEFGVWSLVIMQIAYGILLVMLIGIITRWIPSLNFSKDSLKQLFGFGGYIMAANILQTICQNIQGIIIGKRFSATQMGYFSQAYKLDQITSYSIPQVIVQVMYPVYSTIQDDRERLNRMILMNMRVIAFLVYPILSVLILSAEPLISFLYGSKWLPAAPYFRILCVGGFFVCLQNLNFYAVAAVGESKSLFKWSFYKWGFLLVALLIGMNFGMYGILWGIVLSSANIFITNAYLAQIHTGLKVIMQIKTIAPLIILISICYFISDIIAIFFHSILLASIGFLSIYLFISILFIQNIIRDYQLIFSRIFNKKEN